MKVANIVDKASSRLETFAEKIFRNRSFYALLILITGLGFWISQAFSVEIFVAGTGSSPLHWIYLALDPAKSLIDWPTGTRNMGNSLPMHVYRLSDEYLEADLFTVMRIYIAVEIVAMLFAYYYFSRSTKVGNSLHVAAIFALIAALTAFQSMNLARFGYPFVWGLYYSLASAARILGLALILRDRPWPAMLIFAFGFMTHPIMALFGIIAAAAIVLSRGLAAIRRYFLPTLCMGLISVFWLWLNLSEAGIRSGGIPLHHWYELTKTFNFHWYPFYMGVFSDLSTRFWLPLLSVLMLYVFTRVDGNRGSRQEYEIDLVIIVLGITTLTGLVVSYFELSPFLTKLALHRSSDLLVVIALLPVLVRLFSDASDRGFIVRALSIVLIISPAVSAWAPGFPLGVSLMYTATYIPRLMGRSRPWLKSLILLIWVSALISLAWHLFQVGNWQGLQGIDYSRAMAYLRRWVPVLIYISVLVLLLRKCPKTLLLVVCVWISVSLVQNNHQKVSYLGKNKHTMWYDTQLWARNNTAEDAIFMLDPAFARGWRDVSRRASFGSVREWLHSSWLYDSNIEIFEEGVRRFRLLGMSLDDIYQLQGRIERRGFVNDKLRDRYYTAPHSWFEDLSINEGIDYFVFERKYLQTEIPASKIIFENPYYIVSKFN